MANIKMTEDSRVAWLSSENFDADIYRAATGIGRKFRIRISDIDTGAPLFDFTMVGTIEEAENSARYHLESAESIMRNNL